MRELTEDIGGLILSTIEDLPDVEPLESKHGIVEKDGLTIRNRMFKSPELRKIHIEEAEIGGIKILHCVFFPDPHYSIPIFGCDIVSNGKTVTAAIVDVSPVYGVGEDFYSEIRSLSNNFTFSGKRPLPLWGDDIFSQYCKFTRLTEEIDKANFYCPIYTVRILSFRRFFHDLHFCLRKNFHPFQSLHNYLLDLLLHLIVGFLLHEVGQFLQRKVRHHLFYAIRKNI